MPLLALLLAAAPVAAPAVALAPQTAHPGDAVLVIVHGAAEAPSGYLGPRELVFWRSRDGWRAIAPLPIETAPGPLAAEIEAAGQKITATLTVAEPSFRTTELKVAPKFVEPPPSALRRIRADRKAFDVALAQPFGPPLFGTGFGWPRHTGKTGEFGDQRLLNGKKESVHYGLDLEGVTGAPVVAANDGEVVLARDCYMSGRSVVLWHGAGVYTAYFHLSRLDVRVGQKVRRGERIGAVGATGRVTGPHLHWGVKVDGLYVDPESILRIQFGGASAPPAATARSTSNASPTSTSNANATPNPTR